MTSIELKNLRLSNSMKQSEMASIIGIEQSYFSDIERGKKPIPKEAVIKLNNHFGSSFSTIEINNTISEQNPEYIKLTETEQFLYIMKKQADSLARKDEQLDRLISLLENQLNKEK